MTLFKQIALLVTLVFILLFVVISIDSTKQSSLFIQGQLQTSAQDAATLLGMSISNNAGVQEAGALDALFSAVFDSGYYSNVRMLDVEGNIIHEKTRPLAIDGVPSWFINTVDLPKAVGVSNVMNGWSQVGKLELTIHPGYAYARLYSNLQSTLIWFALLFALVLILLWCLLHIVLKPLAMVNRQANEIHNNRFIVQDKLPKTTELHSVVTAINRMVSEIQKTFSGHEETLHRYETMLYTDKLTGLPNRAAMLSKLETLVSEGGMYSASIAMIKLHHLDVVAEKFGYSSADNVLQGFVDCAMQQFSSTEKIQIARISEDEFSILMSNPLEQMDADINHLFLAFEDVLKSEATLLKTYDVIQVNAALTPVHSGEKVGQILAALDLSLAQASAQGNFAIQKAQPNNLNLPAGKMEWRSWFNDAFEQGRFYLVSQPVFTKNEEIDHQEVFVRINDDEGNVVPAGVFFPMAMALGLGNSLDDHIADILKSRVKYSQDSVPYALNISTTFFDHGCAINDIKVLLAWFKQAGNTLRVEVSCTAYALHAKEFLELADAVREANQYFGVDHLDLSRSTHILQAVRPHYVKVNANVLGDLTQRQAVEAYQALRNVTSMLNIQLIASGIEDQAVYEQLIALDIDAVQGNFLAAPGEIQ